MRFLLILLLCAPVMAQRPTAGRLMGGPGDPTGVVPCSSTSTRQDVYSRTGTTQIYTCIASNTWSLTSGGGGGGSGDVTGPSASTDSELLTASGATGKILKRSNTLNGYVKLTSGVVAASIAIPKADVGLSNVDNTSDATKDAAATTLSNKTVVLPIIASFANANHSHQNSAGGGTLDVAAIGTGVFTKARQHAATVYNDQTNIFGAFAQDFRGADLYVARRSGTPGSPIAAQLYQNTVDSKPYFCWTTLFCGDVFVAGLSGPISTSNGGTGNSSLAYVTLTDGATITWTVAGLINNATVTLGGNRTLAFSGTINGMTGTLIVRQDGTGSRLLTLPAGSKVIGGGAGAITLSTAANAIDVLTWTFDGATYFWTYGKNFN